MCKQQIATSKEGNHYNNKKSSFIYNPQYSLATSLHEILELILKQQDIQSILSSSFLKVTHYRFF